MKAPLKLLILFLLVISSLNVITKDNLTVLSRIGEVRYKSKSETAWKDLKTGTSLDRKHILKVSIESKVNILQDNGKYFTISTPGEYDIDVVLNKLKDRKNGFTDRFFNAVYNILTTNIDYFRDNKYNRENAVSGIVLRNYQSLYPVRSPVNSNFIGSIVTFIWYKRDTLSTYTFRIKDMYEKEVYSSIVNDTLLKIDLSKAGLVKGKYYFWQISNANGKSDENYIYLLSDDKSKNISDTLALIKSEFDKDNESMYLIAKAQYFEENNLIYDAYSVLHELTKLHPYNKDFVKLFVLFLIRHNMMDEAHCNLE